MTSVATRSTPWPSKCKPACWKPAASLPTLNSAKVKQPARPSSLAGTPGSIRWTAGGAVGHNPCPPQSNRSTAQCSADPRPCRAPRSVRAQLLPQPRLLLSGLQLEKGADSRRRFPPLALPPAPPVRPRTHRPPPHPRLRQAPASPCPSRQSTPPQRPPPTSPTTTSQILSFPLQMTYTAIASQKEK